MRRLQGCVIALGCGIVILSSKPAEASPLFEEVGSVFGDGGLNGRAHGASAASAYFNPALLPQAEQGFETGVFVLHDAVDITLDPRSAAQDVPDTILGDIHRKYYPVPTAWLQNGCVATPNGCNSNLVPRLRGASGTTNNTNAYQAIGLVNHILDNHLTLGMYTLVPLGSLFAGDSFYVDEREQAFSNSLHPEMYSDRLVPLSLAFGEGARVTDWLSIGAAFTLSLTNSADATTYVGDAGNLNDTLSLSNNFKAKVGIAPHFSVLVEPTDDLDVSVTLHTPQKMEIIANSFSYLANGNRQATTRTNVFAWLPWVLGLGLSYDVFHSNHHAWAVTGTGTYEVWSQYINRQGERPQPGYEWSNIFTGAVGVRYTYDKKLTTFLDGNYRPSPVPLQTGRTNYVDNNSLGLDGGVNYTFPIQNWGVKLRVGAQAQVHMLIERYQRKLDPSSPQFAGGNYPQLVVDEWADNATSPSTGQSYPGAQGLQTNNPGWPGFGSKGVLVGGGLSVSVLY